MMKTNGQISNRFKIFLLIFVICSIAIFAYSLIRAGESWHDVTGKVGSTVWAIALLYWFFATAAKRLRNLTDLSAFEQSCVEDLSSSRVVLIMKRLLFGDLPDVDGQVRVLLSFTVIMGDFYKWLLFNVFAMGSAVLIYRNDTLFNKALMTLLAIVWCPWVENALLDKINYKIIFASKTILTLVAAIVGINFKA